MARQPYTDKFNNRSLVTLKMFERIGAFPLDPTSVFDTKVEAEAYVAEEGSNAYPGQLISVANGTIDESNGTKDYDLYVVRSDKQLQKISFNAKDIPSMEWDSISNKPSSTTTDIDDAVTKRHEHTNQLTVLDLLTEEDGKIKFNTKALALFEELTWDNIASKPSEFTPATHTHDDADITSVDASKITGVLNIAQIPKGALERLTVVADEEAMLALTKDDVQNGDTVKVEDSGKMYYINDEDQLGTIDAFHEYTAGTASSVAWSGVTETPTDLAGYGITDAVNTSEVVDSAQANKILKLNGDGKLPTDITGDAQTLQGKAASEFANKTHVHDNATELADGFMSKEDKAKLEGIEEGANNYVHPLSHDASMITEDATHRFITDTQLTKLAGIEDGAKVNVQSDWNESNPGSDAYIQNKPTSLPANGGHSDTTGKLQTAVSISLSGDVTGTTTFDGSTEVTINATLANSNVTAGTYKSVTVNDKGIVTAGTNPTTLAGYGIVDAVSSDEIVSSATPNKVLRLNGDSKLPTDITGDAATVGGRNADSFADASHSHTNDDIVSIDASKITGVLNIDQLPKGALERLVVVEDDAAMLRLTTNEVQNGDTVKNNQTGKMYFVVNDTRLGEMDAFLEYSAGTATSVAWSGVTGTPDTVSGYGITDAITTADVVDVATSNKILKLDSNGDLPANITGKAGSVDWANINNKPTSTTEEIDQAVTNAKHTNREQLDKIAEDGTGNVTYNGKALATKEEVGNKIVLSDTEPVGLTVGGIWLSIVK